MKIYSSKDLTEEVRDLDLGTVKAGEKKEFTFYAYNESLGELVNLEFSTSAMEVKIISAPREMKPKSIAEIVIEYAPLITIEQGLKTDINIKGNTLFK